MAQHATDPVQLACNNCGYQAPPGDAWTTVLDPSLGTLTQCPECASTRVENVPR